MTDLVVLLDECLAKHLAFEPRLIFPGRLNKRFATFATLLEMPAVTACDRTISRTSAATMSTLAMVP